MSIRLGTYSSADKRFIIIVESVDSTRSEIESKYEDKSPPKGIIGDESFSKGNFFFVGASSRAPFTLDFSAFQRLGGTSNNTVVMNDRWVGAMQSDGSMLLTGVRGLARSDGELESICLGTQKFTIE